MTQNNVLCQVGHRGLPLSSVSAWRRLLHSNQVVRLAPRLFHTIKLAVLVT